MDFIDELRRPHVQITLGGQGVDVARARIGEWFALERVRRSTDANKMLTYVALATGLPEPYLVEQASISELMAAFAQVRRMNQLHGRFPFMGGGKGRRDVLDYPGRELAGVVHIIASAYGWGRDEILNLGPEEAFCYVLEIEIDKYRRREWEYTISQAGINKQGRKQPYPALNWRWGEDVRPTPKAPRINAIKARARGFEPAGVVIDLATMLRIDDNQ